MYLPSNISFPLKHFQTPMHIPPSLLCHMERVLLCESLNKMVTHTASAILPYLFHLWHGRKRKWTTRPECTLDAPLIVALWYSRASRYITRLWRRLCYENSARSFLRGRIYGRGIPWRKLLRVFPNEGCLLWSNCAAPPLCPQFTDILFNKNGKTDKRINWFVKINK